MAASPAELASADCARAGGTTEFAFAMSDCGVTVGTAAAAGGVIATEDEGLRSGRGSASAGVAAGSARGLAPSRFPSWHPTRSKARAPARQECLAPRPVRRPARVQRAARPASLALTDCGPAGRAELAPLPRVPALPQPNAASSPRRPPERDTRMRQIVRRARECVSSRRSVSGYDPAVRTSPEPGSRDDDGTVVCRISTMSERIRQKNDWNGRPRHHNYSQQIMISL